MISKCQEKSVTRMLNLKFIRAIKHLSFDHSFECDFLFHAQNVSALAQQLYHGLKT